MPELSKVPVNHGFVMCFSYLDIEKANNHIVNTYTSHVMIMSFVMVDCQTLKQAHLQL